MKRSPKIKNIIPIFPMSTQLSETSLTNSSTLYEQDFNLWTEQTVQQLKNRQLEHLDWEHLIEEIESLGGSDKREIERRVTIILSHLLCLAFWIPEREIEECSRGCKLTVREQRKQIQKLLKKSPSLNPYLNSVFHECYQDAREEILYKSSLYWDSIALLPEDCPFTIDEILNLDYHPSK
ncbi:MAG: DUF29 domain-containing protein [Microcystaceae cyanobacterium]